MKTPWMGIAVLSLSLMAPAAWAEPTVSAVVQEIQAGKLDQAQAQMQEVLAKHPNSAEAYYVQARLLARQGKWTPASDALAHAKQLNPAMPFVQAKALAHFEQQLARHGSGAATGTTAAAKPVQHSALGSALAWFVGLLLLIVGVSWFLRRRRRSQILPYGSTGQGFGQGPYGNPGQGPWGPGQGGMGVPGMGQAPGGGLGSGLASGIATGVGLGAGMAAGNALAGSLFGHHEQGADSGDQNLGLNNNGWGDDGGSSGADDFGLGDDDSSWG